MRIGTVRPTKAQSLLEVVSLMVVAVPLFLVLLDGCIFVWALSLSYETCATACRGASMGAPGAYESGAPKRNAESAIATLVQKIHTQQLVAIVPSCKVSERVRGKLPDAAFGGVIDGDISVITTVTAFLPFTCSVLRCPPVRLSRQQTYSYSWALRPHVTSALPKTASN